jgi:predicted GIY-YIG superfamily endonuclease
MTGQFYYVYLLRSIKVPGETYVGFSDDLETRMKDHNRGASVHTAPFRPWRLVSAHAFADREKAKAFERYLKSGSGRAFAKRHLW